MKKFLVAFFILSFLMVNSLWAVKIKTKKMNFNTEFIDSTIKIPVLLGKQYQKLNKIIENKMVEEAKALKKEAEENLKGEKKDEFFRKYSCEQDFRQYESDSILSLVISLYEYTGGAHGGIFEYVYHIDKKSGKILKFNDIFKTGAKFFFNAIIRSRIKRNNLKSDDDSSKKLYFEYTSIDDAIFYFDGNKLIFQFQEYSIAPYSEGMPRFSFIKSQYKKWLK